MDLVDDVENALKHNINILRSLNTAGNLAVNKNNSSKDDALKEFDAAVHKLEEFFLANKIQHSHVNKQLNQEEEIESMKIELARKDNLIQEQARKLAVYQSDLTELKKLQTKVKSIQ
jgi:hypothetical protein